MIKTLEEAEQQYDLELDRAVKEISKIKQKEPKILLQFPDGLKQYSTAIVEYLESKLPNVNFSIWMGSCFGACDVPQNTNSDLIIQFGHAPWK
jgi:2-(3-amino-3-carboxypropyl)histidine synthase